MSTVEEKFSRVTGIEGEQVASLAKGVAAAQYRESAQRVMAITVSLQVAEALENQSRADQLTDQITEANKELQVLKEIAGIEDEDTPSPTS
jgi:uncharacterized protein HemY